MASNSKKASDTKILAFMVLLCALCGLVLSLLSYILGPIQQEAQRFDQQKQLLISAKILDYDDYFLTLENNHFVKASFDSTTGLLTANPEANQATEAQIKQLAQSRIHPLLTDKKGAIFTFKEKKISLKSYLEKNYAKGFSKLPFKLFYAITPNTAEGIKITDTQLIDKIGFASVFVFPIQGPGLWGPIHGYLSLEKDGNTVLGTTWYDQQETPGLGANIASEQWQKQFYGKKVFHSSSDAETSLAKAPLGIVVVKGKVSEVFGTSPESHSAVDGISGATLTGQAVTAAYHHTLSSYRALLLKIHGGS